MVVALVVAVHENIVRNITTIRLFEWISYIYFIMLEMKIVFLSMCPHIDHIQHQMMLMNHSCCIGPMRRLSIISDIVKTLLTRNAQTRRRTHNYVVYNILRTFIVLFHMQNLYKRILLSVEAIVFTRCNCACPYVRMYH